MRRDVRPWTQSQTDLAGRNVHLLTNDLHKQSGPNVVWETHHVTLHKAPTFGFGIAVSGGRDSPHFANGDPSVAISDVLKAGPAEGKLQINDRIITVNGISLENVDHSTAINVLRDCGNTVNLVVRRRILLPASQTERSTPPFKITLNKKNKKDEFGIVLGCKLFIKEITPHSLAAHEAALKEGDTVLKISNTPVENLSLAEAKKLLEKSKEKLQLIVSKERREERVQQVSAGSLPAAAANDIGLVPAQVRDKDDVNVYRPSVRSEEDIYVKDPTSGPRHAVPPGAYPNSENTRFDGRYVLDNDIPNRSTLPRGFENNIPQHQDGLDMYPPGGRDMRDGYYSDRDDGWRGREEFPPLQSRPMEFMDDEVFPNRTIHDLDPRRVSFPKDKQTGLGLRLAGGNATGIFIASVQPGSAGEREGLVEGDNILLANDKEILGMTREEAVSYLTSLVGQVTMVVQYRKEEYDRIMTSHEAGDSFYIRAHFNHTATDLATEHSFKVGDIFHVKDTLFRGVGGSWLALKVSEDLTENKKGTIPNSKTAEILKTQQREDSDKENFPNRGRGSLFKRKSSTSRRSKSLGKDHWDEVIFDEDLEAGLDTKFPAYERVLFREPGFVRPVVLFGAISDIARERLLSEYPDRFESPQVEKPTGQGDKKEKSAIIRLGSIREAISSRKHCLLDVTPLNVDRLNYAQYNPIVVFLKADSKQAVKDVRGRWKTTSRNPRKLLEQSEKIEKTYSYLFTGTLKHMGTDAWFPKLCEMIDAQQRQKIWMSEKQPQEDMSDDFMFPMSTRLSYAAGADSDLDIPRPRDDIDVSPMRKQRLIRSSSDPSVNTHENIPGIPPYPSPPTYKNQRIPSHDSRYSVSESSHMSPPRDDYQMHPEDRYYPSYYSDRVGNHAGYPASRAHIDPYATLTPSERLRPRVQPDHFQGGYDEFGPYRERIEGGDNPPPGGPGRQGPPLGPNSPHMQGTQQQQGGEHRGYNDNSSHSSDSYSKYVSSPQNKHDDTKLREKFGNLQILGRDKSPGHDPYRFTRSTANPITGNVDKAKLSDLSAKYRKQDSQTKLGPNKQAPPPTNQQPVKKKEPPPVPVKTYSLKQRGIEPDELKMRNYENSNRAYNYADVNAASSRYGAPPASSSTPPLPPPPSAASYPSGLDTDRPYEYMSVRAAQSAANFAGPGDGSNNRMDFSPQQHHQNVHLNNRSGVGGYGGPTAPSSSSPQYQHHLHNQQQLQQQFHQGGRGVSLDSAVPQQSSPQYPPHPLDPALQDSKAFANEVYMDHQDLYRSRPVRTHPGGAFTSPQDQGMRGERRDEIPGGIPTLERGYARPRTDDEQIQELQRSRNRARSETRLAEISNTQRPGFSPQWNNPGSSGGNFNRGDDANYRRIAGGGGGSSSNIMMMGGGGGSSSNLMNPRGRSNANRDDANVQPSQSSANSAVTPGSAFSSYKRPVKQASFSGSTAANPIYAAPNFREGRSGERSRLPAQRSHSVGSALRHPLIISPRKPPAPQPLKSKTLPPPPPPLPLPPPPPPPPVEELVQAVLSTTKATSPKKEKSKSNREGKRPRSPILPLPPPPEFPPPSLSNLPLPPPPPSPPESKITTNEISATTVSSKKTKVSESSPSTSSLPLPLPPPPPAPPIKTVPLPLVKKNEKTPISSALTNGKVHSEKEGKSDVLVINGPSKKDDAESIDEKHTIIATAKGYFTSKGGILESPETGVSIFIPEGAIEENKEQEIYFKVCRDNSLLPPLDAEKGETLLSPLVMCGPHGTTFKKSVELRLPHTASANPESWSFALKSSDSPSGQTTEWQNMTLAEGGAKGRVDQSSVSILVDHF